MNACDILWNIRLMTFLAAAHMHSNKQQAIYKFGNFTNCNSNTSHEIIASENFCFVHLNASVWTTYATQLLSKKANENMLMRKKIRKWCGNPGKQFHDDGKTILQVKIIWCVVWFASGNKILKDIALQHPEHSILFAP